MCKMRYSVWDAAMGQRYRLTSEQIEELQALRKRNKDETVERRIKTLLLYTEGEKTESIALQTGYARTYIFGLVSHCHP